MNLLTPEIREALIANLHARRNAQAQGEREPDPVPVVRFFNPLGAATWLATELDEDGILFGLADLGLDLVALTVELDAGDGKAIHAAGDTHINSAGFTLGKLVERDDLGFDRHDRLHVGFDQEGSFFLIFRSTLTTWRP